MGRPLRQPMIVEPDTVRLNADKWTVSEFLEFEQASAAKHEFVDGEIYNMAGGSKDHNRIAGDLFRCLSTQLDDENCEVFVGDVLLEVSPSLFYYPDVYVVCNAVEDKHEYVAHNPVLIAEVLSPSTKRVDRHEKLEEYKRLPQLRECLLIHQDRVGIELYSRATADAEWQQRIYTNLQDEISFASINAQVKVAEIYRRVFAAAPDEEMK